MPKGFLIKRNKHYQPYSYRNKEDAEKEDHAATCLVDQENRCRNLGSPDSGFSQSPLPLTVRYNGAIGLLGMGKEGYSGPLSPTRPESAPLRSLSSAEIPGVPESARSVNSLPTDLSKNVSSISNDVTDIQPIEKCANSDIINSAKSASKPKVPRQSKAVRKIDFVLDHTSPVSGTIIKCNSDSEDEGVHVTGDIDSSLNFVEVTPEARAELEKIENKIGDYICQLCKEWYEDAFQLAQHRCSRIVHVEYRCPECGKVFNCPANLASHRRWHKPRPQGPARAGQTRILPAPNSHGSDGDTDKDRDTPSPLEHANSDGMYVCGECGKKFRRQAFLQKHRISQHSGIKPSRPEQARSKTQAAVKDFSCKVCGSSFNNKLVLEKHMRCHGSEVFPCKYCNSTFCSSPGLTRHINKCHPSENKQVILLQLPVENRMY